MAHSMCNGINFHTPYGEEKKNTKKKLQHARWCIILKTNYSIIIRVLTSNQLHPKRYIKLDDEDDTINFFYISVEKVFN